MKISRAIYNHHRFIFKVKLTIDKLSSYRLHTKQFES